MSRRDPAFVRTCYICLMTDEEETTEERWVHPCRCKGTTKWCHETCILRWIEEKQRDNSETDSFRCPVCHTAIIVVHPQMSLGEKLCELADRIATRISPFGAVLVGVGSIYWAALGFGAASYVQVFGTDSAIRKWNESDPLVVLVTLPCIPLALLATRLVNWEDAFLDKWRQSYSKLPSIVRHLLPIDNTTLRSTTAMQLAHVHSRRSYSRILISACLFPSGSILCGRLFLPHLRSRRVRQALLGALMYIALKGALAIYTKHSQWLQRARREVQDYDEDTNNRLFALYMSRRNEQMQTDRQVLPQSVPIPSSSDDPRVDTDTENNLNDVNSSSEFESDDNEEVDDVLVEPSSNTEQSITTELEPEATSRIAD